MKTVTKQANQLVVNDVIVAPDGGRHIVNNIVVHGLASAWLTFTTDSGLKIDKSQDDAKLDTYEVEAP